jgi:hypothetical protein
VRDETIHALEALMLGLVVGVLHLAWVSGWFSTEQGTGGLTVLLGCSFTTFVLWAMLALRSLAEGGPLEPEVDDGVSATAATAWVIAVVPPRAANFLPESGVDDFARVYVPVCLGTVFAMLLAQRLFRARTPRLGWVRLGATVTVAALGLAACIALAQGPGAADLALRAVGWAVAAALATAARVALGFR